MAASDYRRLPGKAARYQAVTGPDEGQVISKRAHDNMRAKEAGFGSLKAYRDVAKTRDYQRHLERAADATGMDKARIRRMNSDFNKLFSEAYIRANGTVRSDREVQREAGAELFDLLSYLEWVGENDRNRYIYAA